MEIEKTWSLSRERRVRDNVVASAGLAALAPFALGAAGVIYGLDQGNPLFSQQRIGHNREPFTLYKVRTMPVGTLETTSHGHHDSRRSNKFARFLSTIRVDETPQLINVLRGEMAIVGWRPLLKVDYENVMDTSSPSEQKDFHRAMAISMPGFADEYGLNVHQGLLPNTPENLREAIIDFANNTSKANDMATMRRAAVVLTGFFHEEFHTIISDRSE